MLIAGSNPYIHPSKWELSSTLPLACRQTWATLSLTSRPGEGDRERRLTQDLVSLCPHSEHVVLSGGQRGHPVAGSGQVGYQGAPRPCAGLQGLDGVGGLLGFVGPDAGDLPGQTQGGGFHLFNLWTVDGSWDFCKSGCWRCSLFASVKYLKAFSVFNMINVLLWYLADSESRFRNISFNGNSQIGYNTTPSPPPSHLKL